MRRLTAEPVTGPVAFHGEGPVWHPSFAGIRFVDMLAGDILQVRDDGTVDRFPVGAVAAAFRPRRGGGLVVAVERGFVLTDAAVAVERDLGEVWSDTGVRMNEGGCDPQGGFYCGSMAYDATPGAATLYRLAPDLTVTPVLGDVTISNGLGFTADGALAYYNDTPTGRIDVFDHDPERGLTGRRPFVDTDGDSPDGLTVDADGGVWAAFYGASQVRRYTPGGALDVVVDLPVTNVTACAFGGPALDRLYITTSRENVEDGAQPLAGALFAVDPGATGLPVLEFAG